MAKRYFIPHILLYQILVGIFCVRVAALTEHRTSSPPCCLCPAPYSLLPAPCSLKPNNFCLTQFKTSIVQSTLHQNQPQSI
ncbi:MULTISPECIES: hypothetical protein [Moorena]|uniref:hypothetical protein n=1 Tax=Moorena TaxID=1155738 RepID=UPI0002E697CC|nr:MULTISPECIES: hypothetical protein [Moorena]NEP36080.1 hypothetical protein [Moorena sp. SIO3B2]